VDFYRLLTVLAARILLGIAIFVWTVIALFDDSREGLRAGFAAGAIVGVLALVGLARGWSVAPAAGAAALFGPIGLLAHWNGASPWAWLFWVLCAAATERWLRDAGAVQCRAAR
jgi:hypothetical protein